MAQLREIFLGVERFDTDAFASELRELLDWPASQFFFCQGAPVVQACFFYIRHRFTGYSGAIR